MEDNIHSHWVSPQFYSTSENQYIQRKLGIKCQDSLSGIVEQQSELRDLQENFIYLADSIIEVECPFHWYENKIDRDECLKKDIGLYTKLIYYSIYAGNTYLTYKWGVKPVEERKIDIDFYRIGNILHRCLENPSKMKLNKKHKPYICYLYDRLFL